MFTWFLMARDLRWKKHTVMIFLLFLFAPLSSQMSVPFQPESHKLSPWRLNTADTESHRTTVVWIDLSSPTGHSFRRRHLSSSSHTAALHPACLRALKVSTANSTWALNYLINLGWQGRLKPLCDPQAPNTDISRWMGGHITRTPSWRPLKCFNKVYT